MEGIVKKLNIGVVFPLLNCLKFTEAAFASLKSYHNLKVVFIDNGSTDGTMKWLKALAGTQGIGVMFNQQNLGAARSWNVGISACYEQLECDLVLVANNDVLFHINTVDVLAGRIQQLKAGILTPFNISGLLAKPENIFSYSAEHAEKVEPAPDFSCFMISKKCFYSVGPFDERFYPAYFEDNDYHYRMKLSGFKALKTRQAVYYHYGSRTKQSSEDVRANCDAGYLQNRDYYKRKWGGLPGKEKFKKPFDGGVF